MTLENIKFNKMIEGPAEPLRFFLAAVFLSAGIFRIFNPAAAEAELAALNLPSILSWLLVIFEIGAGGLLLFNKAVKTVARSLFIFLLCAVVYGLILNGRNIFTDSWELFVFRLTPTDVFLHIAFIFMLLVLILSKKKI